MPNYGATLEASRGDSTEELTQSSLFSGEVLARTYQLPDGRLGLKGKEAAYGMNSCELLKQLDPVMYLMRMCVEQSISPSIPCEMDWKPLVTKSGESCLQQLHLALLTDESECSSSQSETTWPTPTASAWKGGASAERYAACGCNPLTERLDVAVQLWRTPEASCYRGGLSEETYKRREEQGLPLTLNYQVAPLNAQKQVAN